MYTSKLNLVGKRFGRLTVIEDSGERTPKHQVKWHCVCDCGNHVYVPTCYLTTGDTRSCGCLFRETCKQPNTLRHGDASPNGKHTRLYESWHQMRKRCNNPKDHNYRNYGGRGITVCTEWETYEKFRDWALNNGYATDLSIDRIDVNGNYEPSNCRWADSITQGNNRRTNRFIEYNGEKHTLAEWARLTGISDDTLAHRLKDGWSIEDVFNKPVRSRKPSCPGIEYNGETHSIAEWSRITGIPYFTLIKRFEVGWSATDALTIPAKYCRRNENT